MKMKVMVMIVLALFLAMPTEAYTITGKVYSGNRTPEQGIIINLSFKDFNGTNQLMQQPTDSNGEASFSVANFNAGDYFILTSDGKYKLVLKFLPRNETIHRFLFSENVQFNFTAYPPIVTKGKSSNITLEMKINNAEKIAGIQFNTELLNVSRLNVTSDHWNRSFYKKFDAFNIIKDFVSSTGNASYDVSACEVFSNSGQRNGSTITNNYAAIIGACSMLNGIFISQTLNVSANEYYNCSADEYIRIWNQKIGSPDGILVGNSFVPSQNLTVTSAGDLDGNGVKNIFDRVILQAHWNKPMTYPCASANYWCRADSDGNGVVNTTDNAIQMNAPAPIMKSC